MPRYLLLAPLLLLALGLIAPRAEAHPLLQAREATIGAAYRAVLTIPHGCDGSPTVRIRVQIPEGMIGVKPMPKVGWTVETVRGPYARAYDFYHGGQLTEGVKEIVWSGRLADDTFDDFTFAGLLSDTLTAGEMLYFPVDQNCEKGAYQWVEIPAAGQSPHALTSPAPGVKLLPVAEKKDGDLKASDMKIASRTYKSGAIVVEAPWARATAKGMKVGGGYLKITNTGTEPDRLIGGTLAQAGQVEVHEVTMANDVMRMRKLADGLDIGPGKTVELRPGSYHMMFLELSAPLVQGQAVKGTLIFRKAGTLELEYQVAPVGAASGGGGHSHH